MLPLPLLVPPCHKCTGMSTALFDELEKAFKKDGGVGWWPCASCKIASLKLNQTLQELGMKVLDMDRKLEHYIGRVAELDDKIDENTDSISDLDGKVDAIEVRVTEIENATPTDSSNHLFEEELTERESRRPNIMVHSMPEPPTTVRSFKERKDQDMLKLKSVLAAIGVEIDTNEDVKFSRRTGEMHADPETNPRPMVVGFREQSIRDKVLSKARKLPDTDFSEVNIVADLTAKQRKYETELRKKADDLNEQRTEEESLNFKWQILGPRGQRILKKITLNPDHPTTRAGGGGQRANRGRQGPHHGRKRAGEDLVRNQDRAKRPSVNL